MGCSHGSRGLEWSGSVRHLLIDITNVHGLIKVYQEHWGVISGRLMSAAIERSTAFVGSVEDPHQENLNLLKST